MGEKLFSAGVRRHSAKPHAGSLPLPALPASSHSSQPGLLSPCLQTTDGVLKPSPGPVPRGAHVSSGRLSLRGPACGQGKPSSSPGSSGLSGAGRLTAGAPGSGSGPGQKQEARTASLGAPPGDDVSTRSGERAPLPQDSNWYTQGHPSDLGPLPHPPFFKPSK